MTRQEHISWCKTRALEYVHEGNLSNAWGSMCSDIEKHPETQDHLAIKLGMGLLIDGKLNTKDEMKKFIEGFN